MGFFEVDASKCVRCGLCVKDCAFRALKAGNDGLPVLPKPETCMHCQHCFAVCPKGAISLDGVHADAALPRVGLKLPDAESVANWMRVRRSCRQFKDEDVPRETLERILASLGNVPTGCNARGLTFTCYPDRASLARFKAAFLHEVATFRDGRLLPRWLAVPAIRLRRGGEDVFFRNAAGMVVISSDETNPAVTTPTEDVAAACAYFEMLAQADGLATCWFGFLRMVQSRVPSVARAIGLRESTPFYAMLFGKPAVSYARGVVRDAAAGIVWK